MDNKASKFNNILIMAGIIVPTLVLLIIGQNNLYLSEQMRNVFIPVFKAIRDNGVIWGNQEIPVIGAVSRDVFYSELRILNLIFMAFNPYMAYVLSFVLRMVIAIWGMKLLKKAVYGDVSREYELTAILSGIALGLVPVEYYYSYAICSLPLLLSLLVNIKRKFKVSVCLGLLLYPVLSEFWHVGIYVLIALLVYIIYDTIRSKMPNIGLILAFVLLGMGFAGTEYRYIRLTINEGVSFIGNILNPWKADGGIILEISLILAILVTALIGIGVLDRAKVVNITLAIALLAFIFIPFDNNAIASSVTKDSTKKLAVYYSQDFYKELKEAANYKDQWVMALDIPEGVLIYNDFRCIQGESAVETPYLEAYYDGFKDIYSGEGCEISVEGFKDYDGRQIISAHEIADADDGGFVLLNTLENKEAGYSVYLYQTKSRYHEKEHSDIIYEDRVIPSYDIDELDRIISRLVDIANEANDYKEANPQLSNREIVDALGDEEVRELIKGMAQMDENLSTAYAMAEIDYYKDVLDEAKSELEASMYEDAIEMNDRIYSTFREIAESPFYETLVDIKSVSFANQFLDYEDMTEEEKARELRLESLSREYEAASMEDYYIDYEGEEWCFARFNEEAYDLDEEDFYAIYYGLYDAKAKVMGEIYKEIVALNNEKATEKGYDNYAEYAYENAFIRDYSVDDAKNLFKDAKAGANYMQRIASYQDLLAPYDPEWISQNDEATYELIYPYIAEIDSELGESLEHLMKYRLYDLSSSATKPDRGFTTSLDAFGDAYIFDSPYETSTDFNTYIHEFGHYNAYYYAQAKDFETYNNIDIAEVQSQGLEMLMASKYEKMFDEDTAAFLEYNEVNSLVDAILTGSVLAEFEIYAYEHPDATVEELGEEYHRLYNDYGLEAAGGATALNTWIDIQHVFTAPLYYMSYVTSALTALEIYTMSHDDYDLAVEKYMEISALNQSMPYKSACDYVGMGDVFKKGTVKNIMKNIYIILDGKLAGYKQ